MRVEDLIIDGGAPVLEAMEKLDATGRRILFIAPGGRLEAVVTDSDIRRYILRRGDLNRPVSGAANPKPKSLPVGSRREARAYLARHSIDAVPLLDAEGLLVDIVFRDEEDEVARSRRVELPVVVMAGGLGTRLYPYTKILPKPLIPVGESPILELVIQRFYGFGCRDFTLIVNYKKNMIKGYFGEIEKDYQLCYVDEDKPLGTGGGLCLLKGRMKETFFLTNCDILIDADYHAMVKQHRQEGNAITMVCAMKRFTVPYGVAHLREDGALGEIREKPAQDLMINTGMYLVEPAVLDKIEDGVFQGFPDIIQACLDRGERVGIYPVSDASWMDMGQLEELEEMRRRLEEH